MARSRKQKQKQKFHPTHKPPNTQVLKLQDLSTEKQKPIFSSQYTTTFHRSTHQKKRKNPAKTKTQTQKKENKGAKQVENKRPILLFLYQIREECENIPGAD